MGGASADEAFKALRDAYAYRVEQGRTLLGVRRSGDAAVLMFRWDPVPHLFGVPVPLTGTDTRLDWDRPAADLTEWLESVDLWLMEDVENGYLYRARRRAVDDYIELGQPDWSIDRRFYVQVNKRIDRGRSLPRVLVERGLPARVAWEAQERGTLLAWTFAYENNSTGRPVVGHSTVVRDDSGVAWLADLAVADDVPATVAVDLVRSATHAAADAGAQVVIADIDLDSWHPDLSRIAGFRPGPRGVLVETDFLAEDAELADRLLASALVDPGRWGPGQGPFRPICADLPCRETAAPTPVRRLRQAAPPVRRLIPPAARVVVLQPTSAGSLASRCAAHRAEYPPAGLGAGLLHVEPVGGRAHRLDVALP